METERSLDVWLIEDSAVYRRGLARAIAGAPGLRCAREFDAAEAALAALADAPPPAVILLDVGLPGMDGLRALREIRSRRPESRAIILTVFNNTEKILDAVCAGASGYLLKTASSDDVVTAIRQAAEGGMPMTPDVASRVLTIFNRIVAAQPATPDPYRLTNRERDVLEKMAEGLLTKEIGQRLGVSAHTVTNHIRSIYAKLHVNTNTAAVAKAIRERLI